ncbi:MAG TPA: hypothetical protein VL793_05985, partial [Patescibacteria group bacterium]|nr:hypothetical protein [Patescibacteria group bacterium]
MFSKLRIGLLCILAAFGIYSAEATIALNLGSTYAGTITVPGQTNAFTFTGSAGQRLFFDSMDTDGIGLNAILYSPGGVNLYQRNDDYDAGPWTLSETGTYTLVIGANPNTPVTGNYTFRLLDISAAPSLPLGTPFSDQLSSPLACNIYKFNATHGQRFSFQWNSYSTNQFQWELLSPANAVLAQGQYYQAADQVTLPMDGVYALLILGTAPGATPLLFQIQASLATDSAVASSGFGTIQSGTVSANLTNSFSYTASAGLPVYFDSLDVSGQSLVVDLMDPTGQPIFSVTETSDTGPYVLPRSGTYTLNVRGSGGASGNFSFRLLDLTASPTLGLNTVTSNSLAAAYQTDVYQFSGTSGQRLFYDSQVSSFQNIPIRLLGPDGQSTIANTIYSDVGPLTLQVSGTYYFFIQNSASAGTSYQFNLADMATQAALPLNTDFTGTIPAYASLYYQLAGSAGQQLYFNSKLGGSGSSYWVLYDRHNNPVPGASANLSGDFQAILPYSGNYLLVLSAASAPAIFSNQVSTFSYSTNALTLGTAVTNNILNPGDQIIYTFNGTAGQRIYYDALNASYIQLNATLLSPTGVYLHGGNASSDFGPLTLQQSGTYSLVFNGNNDTTGGISFSVLDAAAQPAASVNTDFTGSLAADASAIYRVSATAGQKLYFNAKGGSVGGAYWQLFDPWNNAVPVGSANLGADFEPILSVTGEYVLLLTAGNNPVVYTNQINTYTYTTNAISFGTVITNNLVNPGDQLYYTFN